jgi:methylmalonyl-CoA mutase C-terminal domain/subunit
MQLLKEKNVPEIKVIAGGIIPEKDIEELKNIGIEKVFLPGSSTKEIVVWIQENVR